MGFKVEDHLTKRTRFHNSIIINNGRGNDEEQARICDVGSMFLVLFITESVGSLTAGAASY